MKTIILIFLFSVSALANSPYNQADSDALSQSFNTTPLGKTNHGFVTVNPGEEEKFEAEEQARRYACAQDGSRCHVKASVNAPPPPKRLENPETVKRREADPRFR